MGPPLRIAHVLTLLSLDGSYGGPVSVAVAQCTELTRRGHTVALLTGWDGQALIPPGGFRCHRFRVRPLLPGAGFAALSSAALLLHVARLARTYDVIHVHLARDLVTVPAALVCLWLRIPLIVQTHGMIVADSRLRCRAFDRVAIRRILRSARAHLVLTDHERAQVLQVVPGRGNVVVLTNGVPATTWRAHPAGDELPEVLFCARLHPRKRVLVFADMARLLLARGVAARFTIVGPDEGDLPALRQRMKDPLLAQSLTYQGPLAPTGVLRRLSESQILVLPSEDEPLPMTVLEAWSVGLPTVLTTSNGLAPALAAVDPHLAVTGTAESLAGAVAALLTDVHAWSAAARHGHELVDSAFTVEDVGAALEEIYRDRCGPATSSPKRR